MHGQCQDHEKETLGREKRGRFKRQTRVQRPQEGRTPGNAQNLRRQHPEIREKGSPKTLRALQKLNNGNLNVDEGMEKPFKLGQRVPDGQGNEIKLQSKIKAKVDIPNLSCMEVKYQTPFTR